MLFLNEKQGKHKKIVKMEMKRPKNRNNLREESDFLPHGEKQDEKAATKIIKNKHMESPVL